MATNFGNRFERDNLGRVKRPPHGNMVLRGCFALTGHDNAEHTRLLYNRARCFDPAQGRWLSVDPLGLDADDEDRYRYPTEGA